MLRNKRLWTLLITAFVLVGSVYAQLSTQDLANRYLNKADEALEDGRLNDAYTNITNAMKISKSGDDDIIPTNILVLARTVYRQKLKVLMQKYDQLDLIDVKTNLEKYPEVSTTEITKLVRQIEAKAEEDARVKEQKSQQQFYDNMQQSSENTTKAMSQVSEAVNQMKEENRQNAELQKQQMEQQKEQTEVLKQSLELNREESRKNQNNFRNIFILLIIVVVVILLVVLLIVLIVRSAAKHSQIQQAQYVEAFKLLAQNQSQTNQLMIGGIAGLYGDDGLKLAGSSSTWSQDALPPPEETPEEKEELRELAAKCEDLGAKIDQITGRKNNSKNVSELVYKLATKLGVHQHEAMVYFCASMVYDAGFLGIDPELVQAEQLTEEQRKELQRHIDLAEEYLQFVPRRYWEIFSNAARLHHENMDGSGMPEGLKGEAIPKIARIIRVADSFNAISSRRAYRAGIDKESAIEMLEEKAELYDPDVIQALKDII